MGYIDSLIKSLGITSDVNAPPRKTSKVSKKIPKVPVQIRSTVKSKRPTKAVHAQSIKLIKPITSKTPVKPDLPTLPTLPLRPQRDDCPYLITVHAQRKYPLKEINKILNKIQICTHGWFCEKCCHEYTGPFVKAPHEMGDTRKVYMYISKPSSTAIDLINIIYDFFFGLIGLNNVVIIIQTCNNVRCINYFHWRLAQRIFNPSAEKLEISEYQYYYSQVCIHGENCERCCWTWAGPWSQVSGIWIPFIRGGHGKGTAAVNVIIEQRDGVHITRDHFIQWSCHHSWCMNPAHISVTKSPWRVRANEKITEGHRRRVERRKILLALS